MDPVTVGLSVLGILLNEDDKESRRRHEEEMERQKRKTERNVKYAEMALKTITAIGGLYIQHKSQQQNHQQFAPNDSEQVQRSLPPPPPPPASWSTGNLVVNYDSIYLDEQNNILSAQVVEQNTGQIHSYAYYLQKINDQAKNVLESIDGSQWRNVGIVDFGKMSIEDIGKPESGGKIFGEIFKSFIVSQSTKELPPPPPPVYLPQPRINQPIPSSDESQAPQTYEEFLEIIVGEMYERVGNINGLYFLGFSGAKGEGKFVSAIRSYAWKAQNEYMLCVFDDTVFGGADDGFLITDKALYFHNAFQPNNYRILFEDIVSIGNEYFDRSILLNYTGGSVRLKLGILAQNQKTFDCIIALIEGFRVAFT